MKINSSFANSVKKYLSRARYSNVLKSWERHYRLPICNLNTWVHRFLKYCISTKVTLSNLLCALDNNIIFFVNRSMSFPQDFLFGASSASYQIEGGWNTDGKGENIWDRLVHTRPELIENKANGDVACDSYNLFGDDVTLLKEIGFQVYRFSISWARILPTGDITNVNAAGVKYYHALIDKLLQNDIRPMVTMYHWDLPQRLQDFGGWMNTMIVDYVEDYADLLFQLYGDKVKLWITINEPEKITVGYADTRSMSYAPALYLDSPANYIVAYNLLKAHARIYKLYNEKYRTVQKGKVSIVLDTLCYKEKRTSSKEDIQAAERCWAFRFELFANPIYSENGDFPELVKKIVAKNSQEEGRKRSRLPEFTVEEIQSLKGSSDFFALNHYTTYLCASKVEQSSETPLVWKDVGVNFEKDPEWKLNYAGWPVVPWGFREVLCFIKEKYRNPAIFVTENGYCGKFGELDDRERIDYHRDYLKELINAKENFGCNIIGYNIWSLTDTFEWNDGYKYCFGIVNVDFNDPKKKRKSKSSVRFFKDLLRTRTIPD